MRSFSDPTTPHFAPFPTFSPSFSLSYNRKSEKYIYHKIQFKAI